jgi:hypothetical protein
MAERPKLFKIDTEMQRWCELLRQEVLEWPDVSTKPMFGLTGFYHGQSIFAAIPRTRAVGSARSLLIKLSGISDKRLTPLSVSGSSWVRFELESASNINEALLWLERAYEENSL